MIDIGVFVIFFKSCCVLQILFFLNRWVEGQSAPIVNGVSLRLEVLLVEPIEEGGEGFCGKAWG